MDVNILSQLGAELYNFKETNKRGAAVFLGAGASIDSMVLTWPRMADEICSKFKYILAEGESAVDVLKKKIQDGASHELRYSWISCYLQKKTPSLGHQHLTQLAAVGFINTIVTTNWDCLIEESLARQISSDRIKVYVRGLTPDSLIAEALSSSSDDMVNIVKLHGDLHSKSFKITNEEIDTMDSSLVKALERVFGSLSYVIGTSVSDINVYKILLNSSKGGSRYNLIYDNNKLSEIDKSLTSAGFKQLRGEVNVVTMNHDKVNIGGFSEFFTQLNISVQKNILERKKDELELVKKEILSKEEVGLRYINSAQIDEQIEHFILKVRSEKPDLVVFINDPKAPGGLEIKRRLLPWLSSANIPNHDLEVSGERGSRTFERSAKWRDSGDKHSNEKFRKIIVLDAITFSGKTIRLAKDKILELYPNAVVKCGVLVISKMLSDQQDRSAVDFSNAVTDRFEIHFPWGVTQTTGTITRMLKDLGGERFVEITKRPWGALEVLASDEFCSVRQLSLEAGTKLSFQRHFCRDELYVALDDHIGLKIATNLSFGDNEPIDEFSPQISSLTLEKGDYVLIPRGVWHRPEAYMNRVRILEISFGVYDQVYDIERFADFYARETVDGSR